jgi:hypothetical protein
LARHEKTEIKLTIIAVINLSELRIDPANSGKGLTCYSAPFSWKITFESEHKLFELILSACSPKEEGEWRTHIAERATAESNELLDERVMSTDLLSRIEMDITPIGDVFGRPGTLARRISLHRTGPSCKQGMCQVIVNNTFSLSERNSSMTGPTTAPPSIVRSQSLINMTRIPVLSPRRSERMRLEDELADVWTRDAIPYPRMIGSHTHGSLRRAAGEGLAGVAGNVIRKLSIASITSSFTRRSGSQHSLHSPDKGVPLSVTSESDEKEKDKDTSPNPLVSFESLAPINGKSTHSLLSESFVRRTKVVTAQHSPVLRSIPGPLDTASIRTISSNSPSRPIQRASTPIIYKEAIFAGTEDGLVGIRKALVRSGSSSLKIARKGVTGVKKVFAS